MISSIESTHEGSGDGDVPARLEPDRWVEQHGEAMRAYAMGRVRDPEAAADLVQEAYAAAIKSAPNFQGRSTERTWLIGILKNKVLDHFRRQSRDARFFAAPPADDAEGGTDPLERAAFEREDWDSAADRVLGRKEFWEALQGGLARLPERSAEAFVRCEIDGDAGADVSRDLDVTPENLWVIRHRARKALREALVEFAA